MTQELSWDDLNYLLVKVGGTIGIYTWREMSEWERLGIVWTWATKQEWWGEFMMEYWFNRSRELSITDIINPAHFPELIVDFLREREKEREIMDEATAYEWAGQLTAGCTAEPHKTQQCADLIASALMVAAAARKHGRPLPCSRPTAGSGRPTRSLTSRHTWTRNWRQSIKRSRLLRKE